jgi:hypothetical protein
MHPRYWMAIWTCILLLAPSLVLGSPAAVAGPHARAAKALIFSGSGSKRIGTVRLRHVATLRWRCSGGRLQLTDKHGFRILDTTAHRGHLKIARGTYRGLQVSAHHRWRITIR